jgi:mRNA-decapping enzyme subunit 2
MLGWPVGRLLSPRLLRIGLYWRSTKFTVGAMVVWIADDQTLLVRGRFGQRAWGFPGGAMSRREDPVDCALRELREETGVDDVTADELRLVGSHTQQHARHIDYVYLLRRSRHTDFTVHDAADRFEIAEVQWWPVDALPVLRQEAAHVVERYPELLAPDRTHGH